MALMLISFIKQYWGI